MVRFLIILFLASVSSVEAVAQNNCSGKIVSIKGSGWIKQDGTTKKVTPANKSQHSLATGLVLGTEASGEMTLRLSCVKEDVVIPAGKSYKIRNAPEAASGESYDPADMKTGGGNRGNGEFIFFPLEKETTVIRPETVVFRWFSVPEKLTLSITKAGTTDTIWSGDVDGGLGHFYSAEMRKALAAIRLKAQNADLVLTLRSVRSSTENSTNFRIFPLTEEEKLKKAILETRAETGVFGCLRRADIYMEKKLYIEAAAEYEKALKISPANVENLLSAAKAQDLSGNFDRRDQIEARLRKVIQRK